MNTFANTLFAAAKLLNEINKPLPPPTFEWRECWHCHGDSKPCWVCNNTGEVMYEVRREP